MQRKTPERNARAKSSESAARPPNPAASAPVPLGDLREPSLDRYALLADHTSDIVYFVDKGNRIVEANAAAASLYGYTVQEMIGLDVLELESPGSRDAALNGLERARSLETVILETTHCRRDGAQFPVEVTLGSRRAENGESEIITIVRDTVGRRPVGERTTAAFNGATERSQINSAFVSAMGHAIRTPMNTILGMGELLLDTGLTSEQRSFADGVLAAGKSLLDTIDDVFDYSDLSFGHLEFEVVDVDVAAIVEALVADYSQAAKAAGLTLTTRLDPQIDRMVRADGKRLRQILAYLIDNAITFTKSGTVVVSASLDARDEWSTTLRFAVEDSGPGVDPDVVESIFEPFRQADRSASRFHTGAGLGLPIASRLVDLLGGKLALESVPSVGSTFSFSASFERAVLGAETLASSIVGARVLVVDDDPTSRAILHRHILSYGLQNGVASGGREALDILKEGAGTDSPYDVVIVDYMMPGGMGGLELGMRIKADPELAGITLILVTAYSDLHQQLAVEAAGFASFLAKPVGNTELLESLAKAVHIARARELDGAARRAKGAVNANEKKMLILLAEDHAVNRELALQQLKKLGFDAIGVNNGEEALAALASDRFDLILMDCQMPAMDGFAATRAIRGVEEETGEHVAIVALTANALVRDRRECLDAGMDDYLAKPVRLGDLDAMIRRWKPVSGLGSSPNEGAVSSVGE